MKSLIYISTAAHDISKTDIESIAADASRNNKANDLTGYLVFNGRNFVQFLEGPEKSVDHCVARIRKDARHDGLVILKEDDSKDRQFPRWSMRARDIRENDFARDWPTSVNQVTKMIFNAALALGH